MWSSSTRSVEVAPCDGEVLPIAHVAFHYGPEARCREAPRGGTDLMGPRRMIGYRPTVTAGAPHPPASRMIWYDPPRRRVATSWDRNWWLAATIGVVSVVAGCTTCGRGVLTNRTSRVYISTSWAPASESAATRYRRVVLTSGRNCMVGLRMAGCHPRGGMVSAHN